MYKSISKELNDAVMSVVSGQPLTEGSKEEYEKFFRAALKKFGAESPADLDDEKKKEFFDYVDTNYKGEKTEESVKRYTFSVEEDDPDSIEKKDDDEEEDSVDEDAEDGNISPETVNAVIKLLNKRKLEGKKAKTEEDEKEEDKEDEGEEEDKGEDKEEKGEDKEEKDDEKPSKKTVPKEKTPEEERKEEGRPPIKLSGKKNKVNVNK